MLIMTMKFEIINLNSFEKINEIVVLTEIQNSGTQLYNPVESYSKAKIQILRQI